MTGGNGLDGQTTLTAIDAMEMGGTLVIEAGSVVLNAASHGDSVRAVLRDGDDGELLCGLQRAAERRQHGGDAVGERG